MIEPEQFDVIDLIVDVPEANLRAGTRGAIVDGYSDGSYEVEFTNDVGETIALCALSADQFIVVWKAETRTWLPVSDQVAALMTRLPQEARQEVLDFARFLAQQKQSKEGSAPTPASPL
jgi:hypothetical protein